MLLQKLAGQQGRLLQELGDVEAAGLVRAPRACTHWKTLEDSARHTPRHRASITRGVVVLPTLLLYTYPLTSENLASLLPNRILARVCVCACLRARQVYRRDGSPSTATRALALCLTARRSAELKYPDVDALVALSDQEHADHSARATLALATVASAAIDEMDAAMNGWEGGGEAGATRGGFEAEARAYCKSRRRILERAGALVGSGAA